MLGFKVYYLLSSFLAKLLYDYFTAKAAISAIMTKGGKYVAYFILVEQNSTIRVAITISYCVVENLTKTMAHILTMTIDHQDQDHLHEVGFQRYDR